jgi:hypothetical protein
MHSFPSIFAVAVTLDCILNIMGNVCPKYSLHEPGDSLL